MELLNDLKREIASDAQIYYYNGLYHIPKSYWEKKAAGTSFTPTSMELMFNLDIIPSMNQILFPKTNEWIAIMIKKTQKPEKVILKCLYQCTGSRINCEKILTGECTPEQKRLWTWDHVQDQLLMEKNPIPELEVKRKRHINRFIREKGEKAVEERKLYLKCADEIEERMNTID